MKEPVFLTRRIEFLQNGGVIQEIPMEERRLVAFLLKEREGWLLREIAELMGVSESQVSRYVEKVRRTWTESLLYREEAEEILNVLLSRNDMLYHRALRRGDDALAAQLIHDQFTMLHKTGILPDEIETLPQGREELLATYQRLNEEIQAELQRGQPIDPSKAKAPEAPPSHGHAPETGDE